MKPNNFPLKQHRFLFRKPHKKKKGPRKYQENGGGGPSSAISNYRRKLYREQAPQPLQRISVSPTVQPKSSSLPTFEFNTNNNNNNNKKTETSSPTNNLGRSKALQFIMDPEQVRLFLSQQPIRTPLPAQVSGAAFMAQRMAGELEPKHILGGGECDGPRVGKCQTILMAILSDVQLRVARGQYRFGRPWLILAPKDALPGWVTEFKWTLGLHVLYMQAFETENVDDLEKQRLYLLNQLREETDVIITTYSMLALSRNFLVDYLMDEERVYRGLVCDEAHNLHNTQSLAYKQVLRLQADARWFVSGTPIQNSDWNDLRAALRIMGVSQEELRGLKTQQELADFAAPLIIRRVHKIPKAGPVLTLHWSRDTEHALYEHTWQQLAARVQQASQAAENEGRKKPTTELFRLINQLRHFCMSPYLCYESFTNGTLSLPVVVDTEPGTSTNLIQSVFGVGIILFPWDLRGLLHGTIAQPESSSEDAMQGVEATTTTTTTPAKKIPYERALRIAHQEMILAALDYENAADTTLNPELRTFVNHIQLHAVPPVSAKERWICRDLLSGHIDLCREKAVIFCHFREPLRRIATLLDLRLRLGIPHARGYAHVHGGLDMREKIRERDRFANDPECGVLLAMIDVNKEGLDLSAGNHVVLYDPWWNPALEYQARCRVLGINQTRPVFYYRLCMAGTIDVRVTQIADKKVDMDQRTVIPQRIPVGMNEMELEKEDTYPPTMAATFDEEEEEKEEEELTLESEVQLARQLYKHLCLD